MANKVNSCLKIALVCMMLSLANAKISMVSTLKKLFTADAQGNLTALIVTPEHIHVDVEVFNTYGDVKENQYTISYAPKQAEVVVKKVGKNLHVLEDTDGVRIASPSNMVELAKSDYLPVDFVPKTLVEIYEKEKLLKLDYTNFPAVDFVPKNLLPLEPHLLMTSLLSHQQIMLEMSDSYPDMGLIFKFKAMKTLMLPFENFLKMYRDHIMTYVNDKLINFFNQMMGQMNQKNPLTNNVYWFNYARNSTFDNLGLSVKDKIMEFSIAMSKRIPNLELLQKYYDNSLMTLFDLNKIKPVAEAAIASLEENLIVSKIREILANPLNKFDKLTLEPWFGVGDVAGAINIQEEITLDLRDHLTSYMAEEMHKAAKNLPSSSGVGVSAGILSAIFDGAAEVFVKEVVSLGVPDERYLGFIKNQFIHDLNLENMASVQILTQKIKPLANYVNGYYQETIKHTKIVEFLLKDPTNIDVAMFKDNLVLFGNTLEPLVSSIKLEILEEDDRRMII